MRSLFFQELVDACSSTTTFAHGEDYSCSAEHDVATCINLFHESLVGGCIFKKDVTLLIDGEFRSGVADKRVGTVTDCNEHGVAFDFEACAFDLDRTRTALFIGFAEFVLVNEHATDVTGFVAKNLGRVLQDAEFDTFFLSVENFFLTGRKFVHATTVDNADLFCTEAESHTGSVHSDVTYADQITTRAAAIGTSAGRLAQVETVAKSAGVSNIDQILTRFQTGLAKARLGEDKTLTQFTKYDDTLTAFLNVIKSLQGIKDVDERTFAVQKIFGRENAAKMSELIAVDFAERWGQIFGEMDVGKIRKAASPFVVNVGQQAQTKETGADVGFEGLADEFDLIFERLGGLEDKQAVKSQRRMFEDFISKSETITGKILEAQDEAERRRLETENVQMKSFEQFAKMAEETEKTKTILAELQKTLVPTIVKGVEVLDGLYTFVKTKGRVFGRD